MPYNELLKLCFENLQNKRLKARLRNLASGYCSGWFYDTAHQRRFEWAKATLRVNLNAMSPRYAATLFLLTAGEQIRKSVYSILRQEQREQQPRKAQDMDR